MLILCVAVLIAILGRAVHKTWANPTTLFGAVWVVVMWVYLISPEFFNEISGKTQAVILIGIIAFFLGSLIKVNVRFGTFTEKASTRVIDLNYRVMLILCAMTFMVKLPDAISNFLIIISGGTFDTIRGDYSAGVSLLNNSLVLLIYNYILTPFSVALYPLCAVDFIIGNRKKWFLAFTLLIALESMFISGGRTDLLLVFLHMLFMWLIVRKKKKLPPKIKKIMLFMAVIVIIAINYMTISRGSSFEKRVISTYISGCIPLMDHYINVFKGPFTFIGTSLSGYLRVLFTLLENIGFSYPAFLRTIETLIDVEQEVSVGSINMNAFVSLFYYFYVDAGYLGVLLYSFIYGFISNSAFNNVRKRINVKNATMLLLLLQGLLFSFIRFQFVHIPYCLSFLVVLTVFKTRRITQNEYINSNTV